MEDCILGAKKLIDKQVEDNRVSLFGISFSTYHKSYCWTNENINAYLELADFEGKTNALSVLASGDHVFNLVCNGITEIDTFDTNKLTEYYALGLKRSMILKYDYEEFLANMWLLCSDYTSLENLTEIISGLLPYMTDKYRIFWKSIIEYNYKLQTSQGTNLNLMKMLCVNFKNIKDRILCNNYLLNKENYEQLRQRLIKANITFRCANAINLSEEFRGQYDFILLSNILDYFDRYWGPNWDYDFLKRYKEKLEHIVKPDGIIFLEYILDYASDEEFLFDNSCVKECDLIDEEVVRLPNDYYDMGVGIVLKRVK